MRCSTAECLNTYRSGSREEVQHATVWKPVTQDRKQCFPDSVRGRTECGAVRSLKASTPVGSSYNSHVSKYGTSLRENDCNTAFLQGSRDGRGVKCRMELRGG